MQWICSSATMDPIANSAYRSSLRFAIAAMVGLAVLTSDAIAQTYPAQPITIIVPFPPGGSVDGVARILGQELQERSGKTFVVENRAGGAGGTVGSASVAQAKADGYTLLLNASIHVVQPLINPNVRYDVVKDFAHIALIAGGPLLVTTHPSVPANTLKEFSMRSRPIPSGIQSPRPD